MAEDWRIKHGTRSRIKAGCTCDVCTAAVIRHEWADLRKRDPSRDRYEGRAVGMTDIGWIILQIQAMSEDKSIPAAKRARARWWYDKLTMADSAPATPVLVQSGGRRRSHNDRRIIASDLLFTGQYTRPKKEL